MTLERLEVIDDLCNHGRRGVKPLARFQEAIPPGVLSSLREKSVALVGILSSLSILVICNSLSLIYFTTLHSVEV